MPSLGGALGKGWMGVDGMFGVGIGWDSDIARTPTKATNKRRTRTTSHCQFAPNKTLTQR